MIVFEASENGQIDRMTGSQEGLAARVIERFCRAKEGGRQLLLFDAVESTEGLCRFTAHVAV